MAKPSKPAPDEVEEILKEMRKAQEPIVDREDSILKEIRKAYLAPSAAQEEKILKDIRKAYAPTAEQEAAILEAIRKAYGAPSAAQEEKIIKEIRKAPAIPLGQIAPDSLAVRAEGMFRRLDQNGDGLLSFDEMPDQLRNERAKWDRNGDGFIDLNEYKTYFQARALQVQEERSSPQGAVTQGSAALRPPAPAVAPAPEDGKPVVFRAGNLPKELPGWFQQTDTDRDGQISLYEWRMSGRPLEEFQRMDRNGDGFLTIAEVLYYLSGRNGVAVASSADAKAPAAPPAGNFGRGGGGRSFGPGTKPSDPAAKGPPGR